MKKSQKSVRAHIRIFMAGIIFPVWNVFALNTNALAGGCTLKFKGGVELKNIDKATWFTEGGIFIKQTDGHYAKNKPLNDLVSVDGKPVSIKLSHPISYVNFKCDKWDDESSYFAYYCEYGYYGGKKIGSDNGSVYYDKCILTKNTEALVDTYTPNGNTKSNELVAKNAINTEPVRDDNVFTRMSNMVDTHFGNDRLGGWRDTDGNFNTMRLASDSIAGMVLGTVGGVITNKIIKKNQIKNGLEILKCTVGGHDVATYGEEFQINFEQ